MQMNEINKIALRVRNDFLVAFKLENLATVDLYVDDTAFRNGKTGWFGWTTKDGLEFGHYVDSDRRLSRGDAYEVINAMRYMDE